MGCEADGTAVCGEVLPDSDPTGQFGHLSCRIHGTMELTHSLSGENLADDFPGEKAGHLDVSKVRGQGLRQAMTQQATTKDPSISLSGLWVATVVLCQRVSCSFLDHWQLG